MNNNLATCGNCGLTWDDSISTSYTPAPGARCPFEHFHNGRTLRVSDIPESFPVRPVAEAMTWERWQALNESEREALRDHSGEHARLVPYIGARVECTRYGERVRFWVGRSTGWKPWLLAVHNTRSHGGDAINPNEELGEIKLIRWRKWSR